MRGVGSCRRLLPSSEDDAATLDVVDTMMCQFSSVKFEWTSESQSDTRQQVAIKGVVAQRMQNKDMNE
jgi:hypothetical protein